MKVYYVNRSDRDDRNYLFRGAMAAAGFRPKSLNRVIAMHKEDYPDRDILCDAAAADGFPEFFLYQKGQTWPGYGHLVCSWSVMRCWRMIAEQDDVAIQFLDDYYLRVDKKELQRLLEVLDGFKIIQLAWHTRDDVFFEDKYNLKLPYRADELKISPVSSEVYIGAGHGCSDWALVLTPEGAQLILDYMKYHPELNTECALTGMHHAFRSIGGIYSVRDNNPEVIGTTVLKPDDNKWVGHLVEFTNKQQSDLIGTHEQTDA